MRVKGLLAAAAVLLVAVNSYAADIGRIVMFLVERNQELTEQRKLDNDILKDLKVDAYAQAGYGQLTKEGTSSLDSEQTRYVIGLKASIPLLSRRERSERRAEMANRKLAFTKEVSDLVGQYLSGKEYIKHEEEHLQDLYNELQWIGRRVEAGVDYQKDYNARLHKYTERRRDLAARKVVNEALLEKILSYVPEGDRSELAQLLEEPVPESGEEKKLDTSLHH